MSMKLRAQQSFWIFGGLYGSAGAGLKSEDKHK